MGLFRFLSKFTFICNIAFLLFLFLSWIEQKKPVYASAEEVIAVPFIKDLIIILGFCAIIINILTNIFFVLILIRGKLRAAPLWLPVVNFIFLLLQIFYFFVY